MPMKKLPTKKVATKSVTKAATKTTTKAIAATTKVTSKKADAGTPLSVIIRRRIEAQKARFHANDNIAAFIQPG